MWGVGSDTKVLLFMEVGGTVSYSYGYSVHVVCGPPVSTSCVWIVWVPSLVIIPNDVLHHLLLQSQLSAAFVVQVSDHF